jgi:hypothetical protein
MIGSCQTSEIDGSLAAWQSAVRQGGSIASATVREEISMKRGSVIILELLLIASTVSWLSHPAFGQAAGGWVTLFDGKNLDH